MNQYENDAADMLAAALAETPNDDFNTSCKVLAGVLKKRDEDVQALVKELQYAGALSSSNKPEALLFQEWATRCGFDMAQDETYGHFESAHTQAARKGWRAALIASPQGSAPAPASPSASTPATEPVFVPRTILAAAAAGASARFPQWDSVAAQGSAYRGFTQGYLARYHDEQTAPASPIVSEAAPAAKTVRWVVPELEMPKPWQKVECAVEEGDGSGWDHPQAGRTYHRLTCCEWNPGSETQQAGWYAKIGRVMERLPDTCIVRLWLSVPQEDVPTFALREKLSAAGPVSLSSEGGGGAGWISVDERLPEPEDTANGPAPYSADVLLWFNAANAPAVGYYDYRADYQYFQVYDEDYFGRTPTHWQPISAPTEAC